MFKWLNGLCDRIFAVSGALACSQLPEFMQQYTQRLGGHVAELQKQVGYMSQAASLSGKSLPAYVDKFMANNDKDFSRQGEIMQNLIERCNALSDALQHLLQSTTLTRPIVFLWNLNGEIAKETFAAFRPAFPITLEGAVYGLAGLLIGWMAYATLSSLFLDRNRKKDY